ncbi:MAG TPA: response regulator [Planctomycetota bacterium]|nr:response regulator [Planctomycetota bacterium]
MTHSPAIERQAVEPDMEYEPTTSIAAPRILVAEDNRDMLNLLTRALRRGGHDVVQAHDGFELMRWIESMMDWRQPIPLFDLVVTDLRMPMFSGMECLTKLHDAGDRTPVIVISAFADSRVRRQALAMGVAAVLDKPLEMEALRAAVELALG